MNDELLTPAQIAERFPVAVGTLNNWRYLGIGPKYRRSPGGRIYYSADDVRAYLVGEIAA